MDFELYAQTLQKTMADALAVADKLSAAAVKDREAAINDTNRADHLLRDWEWASYKKAQAFVHKNRKKIIAETQTELLQLTALKLLNRGKTCYDIAGLLDIPLEMVEQIKNNG